ncbi:MAG: hypothetical protein ABSF47_02390, partial [Minisyncoccia bacterium]
MRPKIRNFVVLCSGLVVLSSGFFFAFNSLAHAATTVPPIVNYQGRLEDSSGNLLGGSGTPYSFRFSLWNTSSTSGGTRLWPTLSPATTTLTVQNGLFDARIGDSDEGFPALDFNFTTSSKIYLQVEVYSTSTASWETLSPRQPIVSSGFAINADTLDGYNAGTSTNNLALLDSLGNLNIGGALLSSASGAHSISKCNTHGFIWGSPAQAFPGAGVEFAFDIRELLFG